MSSDAVVVEEVYDCSADEVWEALTGLEKLKQWFFPQIEAFAPVVGFETQFQVECEGRSFLHELRVLEVSQPTRLAYEWSYGGIPGTSTVTWEVIPQSAGQTLVRLTHSGVETFPAQDELFTREACEGGWRWFLTESLKPWLESRQSDHESSA